MAAPGLLAQILVAKYADHRVPRAKDDPMSAFAQLYN
jgi:transposase